MRQLHQQMTLAFYTEIKEMLRSLDRRETHVPSDTPVNEVCYNSIFDKLSDEVTVDSLEAALYDFESKYGVIKMWWDR